MASVRTTNAHHPIVTTARIAHEVIGACEETPDLGSQPGGDR